MSLMLTIAHALARSWPQAPGWKMLSEREPEIVTGTDENALVASASPGR